MEGFEKVLDFLSNRTVYDMMPHSCKVVVFDVDLRVKDAFRSAMEHEMTFATLWDSRRCDFVGMLTVTDFIDIMLYFRNLSQGDPSRMLLELEEHRISTWRSIQRRNRPEHLIFAQPETSLLDVACMLRKHKIHRIPVLDEDANSRSLLYIITHSRIMDDLVRHLDISSVPVFGRTIAELQIGSFKNVVTVPKTMSLVNVLKSLSTNSISAVPVVDENGVAVDLYSRTDVMDLAAERFYQLDVSVEYALEHRRLQRARVQASSRNPAVVASPPGAASASTGAAGAPPGVPGGSMNSSSSSGGGGGINHYSNSNSMNMTNDPSASRTLHTCTRADTLATVMTRLATHRVHRLVCIDAATGRVEGIVSMSDVFDLLLDNHPTYGPYFAQQKLIRSMSKRTAPASTWGVPAAAAPISVVGPSASATLDMAVPAVTAMSDVTLGPVVAAAPAAAPAAAVTVVGRRGASGGSRPDADEDAMFDMD